MSFWESRLGQWVLNQLVRLPFMFREEKRRRLRVVALTTDDPDKADRARAWLKRLGG